MRLTLLFVALVLASTVVYAEATENDPAVFFAMDYVQRPRTCI